MLHFGAFQDTFFQLLLPVSIGADSLGVDIFIILRKEFIVVCVLNFSEETFVSLNHALRNDIVAPSQDFVLRIGFFQCRRIQLQLEVFLLLDLIAVAGRLAPLEIQDNKILVLILQHQVYTGIELTDGTLGTVLFHYGR